MVKITKEIEVRCEVKKYKKFLKTLLSLDSAAVFPGARGEVSEYNLVYSDFKRSDATIRLRRRLFTNGKLEYSYTEKDKNESDILRVKTETNEILDERKFWDRLNWCEDLFTRAFVYERRFRAENYQIFKGVSIELSAFPFLGYFAEFELKRGDESDLKKILKLFGYSLKDNIQESAKNTARKFFNERLIAMPMGIVFSAKAWNDFRADYKLKPWGIIASEL